MRSRFELDGTDGTEDGVPLHAAPESVDETATPSRFVVGDDEFDESLAPEASAAEQPESASSPLQPTLIPTENDDSWRDEVADRVNRYRARRRPRAPRYPSLTLKFEALETRSPRFPVPETATNHALAMDSSQEIFAMEPNSASIPVLPPPAETRKVLEFPRSLTLPSRPLDELADPVMDRPRILEVPDVASPLRLSAAF